MVKGQENLIPAKPGEVRNPHGISHEKMQLRREAEKYFSDKGIIPYLERLNELAMQKQSPRTALAAISEIIQLTLGKNFHIAIQQVGDYKVIYEVRDGNGNGNSQGNIT